MLRRPMLAGVVLLAALLVSSAVAITWVDVDGSTTESTPSSTQVPADVSHSVSPSQPPTDITYVYVEPGSSGSNVYPWSTSYTQCRFQLLYLASQIGRSGTITEFANKTSNTGIGTFANVSYRMCHTNVNALTTTYAANYGGNTPVVVFSAPSLVRGKSATDVWDSVPVSNFNYNGTDNLLVEIVWIGTPSGSSAGLRNTSLTGNRRVWGWDTLSPTGSGASSACYNARIGFQDIIHDVGCTQVLAPAGSVDSGTAVAPACSVYNYGNQTETYKVRLRIGSSYTDSATVTSHAPGARAYVTFPDWTASPRGTFGVSCSTELTGDAVGSNDKASGSVTVTVKDVGAVAMAVPLPGDTYPKDTIVTPKASWRNYGTAAASFEAWMILADPTDSRVYARMVPVTGLAPGGSLEIGAFPACTLKTAGSWTARCSSYLVGDLKPSNDTIDRGFTVKSNAPPPTPGWTAKKPMPLLPSGKGVKDGGWIAFDKTMHLIYAAKGNKKPDFYAYYPAGDSWQLKALIPAGTEGKMPSKGAAGFSDGNAALFATKGNNTPGFWKYSCVADSWYQKKDVPLGPSNKKVKGGTDLVVTAATDAQYVYLLKGYKNEFYKYFPGADSWHALPDAPAGANVKWDKGSWLAYDLQHTIYAHKAKYHEFYSFNTLTDSWNPGSLNGMPLQGSGGSKKSKDGGCGTYHDSAIYAFKGGNTQEFWKYSIPSNSWTELETIPRVAPGGTKKKKVKAGADVTTMPLTGDRPGEPAEIPAIKGNNSTEFWFYHVGGFLAGAPGDREGVTAGTLTIGDCRFSVAPNPLASGFAVVSFSSFTSAPSSVRVYSATGCLVHSSFALRDSPFRLDLRSMPAGVYLVKFESSGYSATQKLVVQR